MILNVYKETGWTSNDILKKLKAATGIKKAGHAGTLDPLAEGILIVLTDKDTKKQDSIMGQEKEYVAKIGFGVTSPTYDLEGPLKLINKPTLNEVQEKLPDVISNFKGKIEQTAPPYSAKKVKGKKLYDLAREGKEIKQLPVKEIEIFEFEVISLEEESFSEKSMDNRAGEQSKDNLIFTAPVLTCRISCSSGTYIRSIANDMGEMIGVGGVLTHLVRTKVGNYNSKYSKKIDQIIDELVENH